MAKKKQAGGIELNIKLEKETQEKSYVYIYDIDTNWIKI